MRSCLQLLLTGLLLLSINSIYARDAQRGISVGPTHLIGMDWSLIEEDTATRYRVGLIELALSGSMSYQRFRPLPSNRRWFYTGGVWTILVTTPDEGGLALFAQASTGFEWKLKSQGKLGLELAFNLPVKIFSLWGPQRGITRRAILPLPGIYYYW